MTALLFAVVLVGSLASSSLAAETNTVPRSFVGNFQVVVPGGGPIGTLSAAVWQQTDERLVPGYFDYYGGGTRTPFADQIHAMYASTGFWFDEVADGGSEVAFAEGVVCLYYASTEPWETTCLPFAVMFVEVTNPAFEGPRHKLAVSWSPDGSGGWNWDWYEAGSGAFVMR